MPRAKNMLHNKNGSWCGMDLSAAYGADFFAAASAPVGNASEDKTRTDTQQQAAIVPEPPNEIAPSSNRSGDVYMIHLEIAREDVQILCLFIAALILSLLFTSRR